MRRAGFTLIEIVVTVLIVGLMLTSVTQILHTARLSRDTIHNMQEVQLAGPAIMDLIEADLRGIVTTNRPRAEHLRVINRVLLGEDADRLDFVTTTDGLVWNTEEDAERPLRADVNEVGYCLRINPDDDRFLEIYRREGFGVDQEPFREGTYTFLHDRVRSLDIQIFSEDGPDAEPVEEWGVDSTDPESIGLPASLEIRLTLELAPRLLREQMAIARIDKQIMTYTRIVRLPQESRLAEEELPRINVPIPPEPGASDPVAGGGGEPGEGETGAGGAAGAGGAGARGGPAGRGQGGGASGGGGPAVGGGTEGG